MIDLTHSKCGRLTVLHETDRRPGNPNRIWHCRCECGNEIDVAQHALRSGNTQSCGCLNKEVSTKHGMSTIPEYHVWRSMLQRCANPKHKAFKDYGGRGITVCDRWRKFENFIADVGPRPDGRYTIERLDVNGHYEPGNVSWETFKTQLNNTRVNRRLTYQGRTRTAMQWSEELGIPYHCIIQRLNKGWSAEQTLETPSRGPQDRMLTHDGITDNIVGWARRTGMNQRTLAKRLKNGWTVAQALSAPRLPNGANERRRFIEENGMTSLFEDTP